MNEIKPFTDEIKQALSDGQLYTQTGLKMRGWTKKDIETYLPQPDLYRNPVYASGDPTKIWDADIVESIEDAEQVGRRKMYR